MLRFVLPMRKILVENPLELSEKIRQINSDAKIETTNFGVCTVSEILNFNAFEAEKVLQTDFKKLRLAPTQINKHQHFSSQAFTIEKSINSERFTWWMEYFLSFNSQSIFRAKGIIWFADTPRKVVFQAVRSSFILEETDYWRHNETKQTELVFIGREIDRNAIQEALNQLVEE